MAYCAYATVQALLGANVDYEKDLTTTQITAHIATADGIIDSVLCDLFYPFNAYGDTPATPRVIAEASRLIAGAKSAEQLYGQTGMEAWSALATSLASSGNDLLKAIYESPHMVKPEVKTGQVLTFAEPTNAWDLPANEALVASTSPLSSGDPPNVLTDTVRVTSTGYSALRSGPGYEFWVEWRAERSSYVFVSNHAALHDGTVASPTISYSWTYLRERGHSSRHTGQMVML